MGTCSRKDQNRNYGNESNCKATIHEHPHRHLSDIEERAGSSLSEENELSSRFSEGSRSKLIIHGIQSMSSLSEVSAIDSIIDIGAAVCFNALSSIAYIRS
jgi:hypothetical protein